MTKRRLSAAGWPIEGGSLNEKANEFSVDLEFRRCFESGRDWCRGFVTRESVLEREPRFPFASRWNDRSSKSAWKRPRYEFRNENANRSLEGERVRARTR